MSILGNPVLLGGGGSLINTSAILIVTSTNGSTVTINRSGVNKSPQVAYTNPSDNSKTDYFFVIRAAELSGTAWTVNATNGYDFETGSVVVNAAGEYTMTLIPKRYFLKNGVLQSATLTAQGMKYDSSSSLSATAPTISYESYYAQIMIAPSSTGAGIAYFPQTNIDNYSYLHVDGTVYNNTHIDNSRINGWSSLGSNQVSNRSISQTLTSTTSTNFVTFSKDISLSNVSGSMYIGFNVSRASSTKYTIICAENVYLQP